MKRLLTIALILWTVAVASLAGGVRLGRDAAVPPRDAKEISPEEAATLGTAGRLVSARSHFGYSVLTADDGSRFLVQLPGENGSAKLLNHLNRSGVRLSAETKMTLRSRLALWFGVLLLTPLLATLLLSPWWRRRERQASSAVAPIPAATT